MQVSSKCHSHTPSLFRCLLYVVGVVFLVMLSKDSFNRKNFFDENALMAGLVKREFTDLLSINEYAKQLKKHGGDE